MQETDRATETLSGHRPGRPLRLAFGGLAVLFVAGVVTQVFLAGLGVLVDPSYFAWHSTFAHVLEGILLLMLIIGAIGRIGWGGFGLTVLLFAVFTTQYLFIHGLSGPGRALHLVNAFVLFMLGLDLARRGFAVRQTAESTTGASLAGQRRTSAAVLAAVAVVAVAALTLVGVMAGGNAGDETATGDAGATVGASVFRANCAGCHGADGGGGVGPALAGNDELRDARFVSERIEDGEGVMPAFGGRLSDEQIAAVADHVRSSWGNDFAGAPR